jgi:hypothetical protein
MGNCCITTKRKPQETKTVKILAKTNSKSKTHRPSIPKLKLSEIVPSPRYFTIRERSNSSRRNNLQVPTKPTRNLDWQYIFESHSDKNESFLKSDFSSGRGFLQYKKSLLCVSKDCLSKQTTKPLTNFEDSKLGISPVIDGQNISFSETEQSASQPRLKNSETISKVISSYNENVAEESYYKESEDSSRSDFKLSSIHRTTSKKSISIHEKIEESFKSERSSGVCSYIQRGPPSYENSVEIPNRVLTELSETDEVVSQQSLAKRSGIKLAPLKGHRLPSISELENTKPNCKAKGNLLTLIKSDPHSARRLKSARK